MSTDSPLFGRRARAIEADSTLARQVADPDLETDFSPSAVQVANATLAAAMDGASKLTVGPNIKLKGVEITDCDTLEVEGLVEAAMNARVMKIEECGVFRGTAQFDLVRIHGQFEGDLTVRQTLVIHATGKITGKVRYSRLVVEEGGQLSGDIAVDATMARQGTTAQKMPSDSALTGGSQAPATASSRISRAHNS